MILSFQLTLLTVSYSILKILLALSIGYYFIWKLHIYSNNNPKVCQETEICKHCLPFKSNWIQEFSPDSSAQLITLKSKLFTFWTFLLKDPIYPSMISLPQLCGMTIQLHVLTKTAVSFYHEFEFSLWR